MQNLCTLLVWYATSSMSNMTTDCGMVNIRCLHKFSVAIMCSSCFFFSAIIHLASIAHVLVFTYFMFSVAIKSS